MQLVQQTLVRKTGKTHFSVPVGDIFSPNRKVRRDAEKLISIWIHDILKLSCYFIVQTRPSTY